MQSPFQPTTPDEDAQLVVGTNCIYCGQPINSVEEVGMVTPKGRTTGPLGAHTACVQQNASTIPVGMAGGPPDPA